LPLDRAASAALWPTSNGELPHLREMTLRAALAASHQVSPAILSPGLHCSLCFRSRSRLREKYSRVKNLVIRDRLTASLNWLLWTDANSASGHRGTEIEKKVARAGRTVFHTG
jgi:hypothetical protein